jgi:hypothetical protein
VFFGCVTIGNKIYVICGKVGDNPNWDINLAVYEGEIIQSLKTIYQ